MVRTGGVIKIWNAR